MYITEFLYTVQLYRNWLVP